MDSPSSDLLALDAECHFANPAREMSNGTSPAGALAGKRIVMIGGTAGLGLSMSDASKFTTGQTLAVDGGWSLSEEQIPPAP